VSKLFFSISIFQNNLTKKVRAGTIMKSSCFLFLCYKSVFEIFIYLFILN
jgi:hypothetical protein